MKMHSRWLVIAMLVAATSKVSAQNEVDALRYSWNDPYGSVRSMGMGGAFGALGADYSSFHMNPAGIGLYKRGGFELGFGVGSSSVRSTYEDGQKSDVYSNLYLNNIAGHGSTKPKHPSWTASNFGISHMRLRDYNQDINISGSAFNTTLLDVFANQAAGILPDEVTDAVPFGAGLAYQTYLIDPGDTSGAFYIPVFSGGEVLQSKRIERRGKATETAFGYGASYMDQLYFGLSVGFVGVRFRETGNYSENIASSDEPLNNWRYVEELSTRGTGLNVKFGVLARIQEWLRVGAAVHSPTYLTLSDQYTTSMTSDFRDGSHYEWESPYGSFTYSLRTPARYMANMAFILGKSGLVSADYEYTDYSRAQLSDTGIGEGYSFDAENEAVKTIYRGTHSVRAGMEWRLTEAFRLRAGAAYRQSPFESGVAVNTPELLYTGGFGWRKDAFSVEFVLMHRQRNESYYLYDPSVVSETTLEQQRWAGLISLGFRY